MKVIGLISGTSMDGIDAALAEIEGRPPGIKIRLLDYLVHPYPAGLKERIRRVASPVHGRVDQICHLNFYLGHLFAEAALSLIRKSRVRAKDIKLIGSHGQTIFHLPQPAGEPGQSGQIEIRSSLQIGAGAVIAEKTGIATVTDFRSRDLAAGGVGAPLLPYLHYLFFRSRSENRVAVNIGGIANLTYIPENPRPGAVIAFDTGPGNLIIDGLVRKISRGRSEFDRDGQLARKGRLRKPLLDYLMSHEFISRKPPKAAERNTYGEEYLNSIRKIARAGSVSSADLLRTATVCTAESIARNCRRFVFPLGRPETAIICGGGANNLFLLECLAEALPGIRVTTTQEFGLDPKAVEAVGFALLTYETWHGRPGNLPRVTGAAKPAVLGCIYPGNQNRIT